MRHPRKLFFGRPAREYCDGLVWGSPECLALVVPVQADRRVRWVWQLRILGFAVRGELEHESEPEARRALRSFVTKASAHLAALRGAR